MRALLRISKPSVSHVEEEALSLSVFSTTVIDFVLICVAIKVSIHLCFVCRHYFYLSYVVSR